MFAIKISLSVSTGESSFVCMKMQYQCCGEYVPCGVPAQNKKKLTPRHRDTEGAQNYLVIIKKILSILFCENKYGLRHRFKKY